MDKILILTEIIWLYKKLASFNLRLTTKSYIHIITNLSNFNIKLSVSVFHSDRLLYDISLSTTDLNKI